MKVTGRYLAMLCMLVSIGLLVSCNDEDSAGAPSLDHASIVEKDSTLQSAFRGQTIVLFGNNLATTREILINGASVYFNPVFVRNDNIILDIPGNVPYLNADNKVIVVTEAGEASLDLVITQAPNIYSFPGVAENGATITIEGEFFEGLEKVGFVNIDNETDTLWAEIVSVTPTEIDVVVPDGTRVANIYVETSSGSSVSASTFGLNYIIYADRLADGWENWSWSSEFDYENESPVKSGSFSFKQTFTGGWGGVQLFGNDLPLKDGDGNMLYSALKFSIYGGPGTTGKELIVTVNWGAQTRVTLKEGVWTDYTVPMDVLGNPDKINVLVFQDVGNVGVSAPYLYFYDDMGLL